MHEHIRSVRYEKVHDTFSYSTHRNQSTFYVDDEERNQGVPNGLDTVQVPKITMKLKNENDAAVGDDDDKDDSDDAGGFWKV